ncbi:hypothetical protein HAX54_041587 [Datura stramonium]|uniref:Uncharacterized protein n=1 Tax=Datura stramonium TaxID=4076 RepID=A0ABS8SLM6_DATST|nr:hypothetical protein [Datura stramonium]
MLLKLLDFPTQTSPGDVTACKAAAPSSGSPSEKTPPVTPAAKDKNSVSRIGWTGVSSELMLFASLVLA